MKMARKSLRKSAFKRNYTQITHNLRENCTGITLNYNFGFGIDSEITQTFAFFEKIAQTHCGIESEITQNYAIFDKMTQEKL